MEFTKVSNENDWEVEIFAWNSRKTPPILRKIKVVVTKRNVAYEVKITRHKMLGE